MTEDDDNSGKNSVENERTVNLLAFSCYNSNICPNLLSVIIHVLLSVEVLLIPSVSSEL